MTDLRQRHYRYRTDALAADGTPTWGANEDTAYNPGAANFRLRVGLSNADVTATGAVPWELYVSKNGGSYGAIGGTSGVLSADAGSSADDTAILVPRLTGLLGPAWVLEGGASGLAAVDMDFVNGRYYGGTTASLLSCSRASIGYAKNADGTLTQFGNDTLRIGVGTGLLVEDARTNLVFGSQTLSNASLWIGSITAAADQTTAPDGTSTADSLTAVANGDYLGCNTGVNFTCTGGTVYTASVYLKPATGSVWTWIQISDFSANAVQAWVNLSTGASGSTQVYGDGTIDSRSVETLANGWFRLNMSFHFTSTNANQRLTVSPPTTADNVTTINVGDKLYAWGAQVEAGSFASSYIPTTTAAATRAVDLNTIIGELQTAIASATGTIVIELGNAEGTDFSANIVDSNGTNLLGFDSTNHGLASITAPLATGNTANRDATKDKLGLAWSGVGRSLVLNGGSVATDASAQTPSSTLYLGPGFAYIRRIAVWNSKLADATLQALTTP